MSLLDRVVGVVTGPGTFITGSGTAVSILTSTTTPSGAMIALRVFLASAGLAGSFVADAVVEDDDADEPSPKPELDADVEESSNEVAA